MLLTYWSWVLLTGRVVHHCSSYMHGNAWHILSLLFPNNFAFHIDTIKVSFVEQLRPPVFRGLYWAKSCIHQHINRLKQLTLFRGFDWNSSMFKLKWHYKFHLRNTIWPTKQPEHVVNNVVMCLFYKFRFGKKTIRESVNRKKRLHTVPASYA